MFNNNSDYINVICAIHIKLNANNVVLTFDNNGNN